MSRRLTEDEKPKKEAQREKMRTSGWRVAEKTQCVSSPPKTPEEIAQEQAQISNLRRYITGLCSALYVWQTPLRSRNLSSPEQAPGSFT